MSTQRETGRVMVGMAMAMPQPPPLLMLVLDRVSSRKAWTAMTILKLMA